jgi:hypothetical protein
LVKFENEAGFESQMSIPDGDAVVRKKEIIR